jgi:hypothetical protein
MQNFGNIGQVLIDRLLNGTVIDMSTYPVDQKISVEAVSSNASGSVASLRFMNVLVGTSVAHSLLGATGLKGLKTAVSFSIQTPTRAPSKAPVCAITKTPTRAPVVNLASKWIVVDANATVIDARHDPHNSDVDQWSSPTHGTSSCTGTLCYRQRQNLDCQFLDPKERNTQYIHVSAQLEVTCTNRSMY